MDIKAPRITSTDILNLCEKKMAANQSRQWIIASTTGIDGLQLSKAPIPEIGLDDVLVNFRAVSLNHRDLTILNVSMFPYVATQRLTILLYSMETRSPLKTTLFPGLTEQVK